MPGSYQIRSILAGGDGAGLRGQTAGRRAGSTDGGKADRRPTRSLDDDVERSVRAIERAVDNFGALKENCQFYKEMAETAKRDLEDERAERKAADHLLDDLEHDIRSERERAARAEERATAAEHIVRDLEHELETLRVQTERMVATIALLVAAESDARGDQSEPYRQAA